MECPYNSVMYDVVHFTMLHVSTAPPLSLSLHLHSQRGLSEPGGGHLFAPEVKCLNLCGMLHSNYYLVHVQVNSCINKVPAQRCVSLGEVFSLHPLCTLPLTLMHPLPPMKFYRYIPLNTTFFIYYGSNSSTHFKAYITFKSFRSQLNGVRFTWRGLLPSPLGSSSPRVPSSANQSRIPRGEACM